MNWPFSGTMSIAIAIMAVVLISIAAVTTGLGVIVLGAILTAFVLYAAFVVLTNVHRWSTTLYERGRQP